MPDINDGRVIPETGDVYFNGQQAAEAATQTTQSQVGVSYVTSVDGRNIGGGVGIYAGPNGNPDILLDFKTLVAGPGVTLTTDASTITITSDGSSPGIVSFLALTEAPDTILSNGILIGTSGGLLDWITPPVGAGTRVLTFNGTSFSYQNMTSGTVTSVGVTGSSDISVSGATITTSGSFALALANTTVTPGTYEAATITVDAKGRITAASAGSLGEVNTASNLGSGEGVFASKLGTDLRFKSIKGDGIVSVTANATEITIDGQAVSSVAVSGINGVVVSGSPITSSGTISVGLGTTGVTAGSYTAADLTVDAQGRITAVANGVLNFVTSVSAFGSNGVSVTGGPITSVGAFNIALTPANANPGTYTSATVVIDEFGRVTSATSNSPGEANNGVNLDTGARVFKIKSGTDLQFRTIKGSDLITVTEGTNDITIEANGVGTVTSVAAVGNQGIVVTGGPIQTSGSFLVTLSNTTVTPGIYTAPSLTIDEQGRITQATSNSLGEVNTGSNLGSGEGNPFSYKSGTNLAFRSLRAGNNVTISETVNEITINADAPAPVLGNTGVTPGLYTAATVRVEADGRISQISNTAVGTVTSVNVTGSNGVVVAGSPVSTVGTFDVSLGTSGVTPGTYSPATITVDAYGRVTAASNAVVSGNGVVDLSNYATLDGDQTFTGNNNFIYGTTTSFNGYVVFNDDVLANGGIHAHTLWGNVVGNAQTASRLQVPVEIALAGDVTGAVMFDGSANVAITASLGTVAANVGTFGNATTYPSVTVDPQGRVTGVALIDMPVLAAVATSGLYADLSGAPTALSAFINDAVIDTIIGSDDISVSSNATTAILSLSNTTVVPGTYTNATVSVDEKGRLVNVANGTGSTLTVNDHSLEFQPSYPNISEFTFTNFDISPSSPSGGVSITVNAALINGLSDVALTGAYGDLTGQPTNLSDFTNDLGYVDVAGARTSISAAGDLTYNAITGVMSYTAPLMGPGTVAVEDARTNTTYSAIDTFIFENFELVGTSPSGGVSVTVNAAYIAGLSNVALTGDYADLINAPVLFSGEYGDLANTPVFANVATSGAYADLTGAPTALSAFSNDLGFVDQAGARASISAAGDLTYNAITGVMSYTAPAGFSGDYNDLINTPALANVAITGAYADLTGKPVLANVALTGDYADLINAPVLFSGEYGDLANTPTFANVATSGAYADLTGAPTALSAFTNDSGFISGNESITISGDASGSGTTAISLTLANTAVVPGSYTLTSITVDAKGRITAIANGTVSGTGTVTSVGLSSSSIDVSGSPVTSSGVITIDLPPVAGAFFGTYALPTITIDTYGRITAASAGPTLANVATSGAYADLTGTPVLANVALTGDYADLINAPVLFSGEYGDLANTPTFANVAFSGAYGDLTGAPTALSAFSNDLGFVNQAGARASISAAGDLAYNAITGVMSYTAPAGFSGDYNDLINTPTFANVATTGSYNDLIGLPTLFSGEYADLANTPTFANVATSGAYADLTGKPVLANVALTGDYNDLINTPITFSGEYGDLANTPTFANVAFSGAYGDLTGVPTNISVFTNDAGYVTQTGARAAISANGSLVYNANTGVMSYTAPALAAVALSGDYADLFNTPTLANVALTGAYGDLTGTPSIPDSTSDLTNDSGFITGNESITVSGDASGTGTTAIALTLANSGVTAGSYTFSSITVDAKGRITAASSGTPGETNTASNLGGGTGIFAQKTGTDLEFKSLVAGSGVSLSSNATSVIITASGAGGGIATVSRAGNTVVSSATTMNFTANATATASSGVVTVANAIVDAGSGVASVTIPTAYAFNVTLDGSGNPTSVSNLPPGWSLSSISGSTVTINHTLGTDVIPIFVASYGYNAGAFPLGYNQRVPNGQATSAYSFNSKGTQFIFYSFTGNFTTTPNNGTAVVRMLI